MEVVFIVVFIVEGIKGNIYMFPIGSPNLTHRVRDLGTDRAYVPYRLTHNNIGNVSEVQTGIWSLRTHPEWHRVREPSSNWAYVFFRLTQTDTSKPPYVMQGALSVVSNIMENIRGNINIIAIKYWNILKHINTVIKHWFFIRINRVVNQLSYP